MSPRWVRWLGTVGALAALGLGWAAAAEAVHKPFLPGPVETLARLAALAADGTLGPHVAASVWRVVLAALLAFVPATVLGLAAGLSPRVDTFVRPVLYLLHPLPKVVFLPLFFLFLGLGDAPKVALIAFIIFSQLAVAARDGARRLPSGLIVQLRTLGASRLNLWVDAVVPGVLPELFSALRIALGTSVAVLFFAESFASESGVGWFIVDAWGRVAYTDMDAGILALALIGVVFLAIVDALEGWLCSWRG